MRDKVFISYSHKDRTEWLEPLVKMLTPLVRKGSMKPWSDQDIMAGQRWRAEIDKALDATKVAVLLVSHEFLASSFIADAELPYLLAAEKRGDLKIVWFPVGASLVDETPLGAIQAATDPSVPLNTLSRPEAERELVRIAKRVQSLLLSSRTDRPR